MILKQVEVYLNLSEPCATFSGWRLGSSLQVSPATGKTRQIGFGGLELRELEIAIASGRDPAISVDQTCFSLQVDRAFTFQDAGFRV